MTSKKRIPKGQINKKNSDTIKALQNLMKDLNQKVSIRVGIIGDKAREKHPDSDITNAQLGAIHEFGADIQVTDKMRGYFWHKWGIHLSKKIIHIPARSFLRETLLSPQGKEELLERAGLDDDRELNKELVKYKLMQDSNFFLALCEQIGMKAVEMIQTAFYVGGRPKEWQKITEFTKANRKNDPESPPLTDSGQLRDSITYQIKEHKK